MEENISKFDDRYKRAAMLMVIHFSGIKSCEVEKLKCEICQDFKEKNCPGKKLKGKEVAQCMWERSADVDIEIHRSLIQ